MLKIVRKPLIFSECASAGIAERQSNFLTEAFLRCGSRFSAIDAWFSVTRHCPFYIFIPWWQCLLSAHSRVDSSVTFLHIYALIAVSLFHTSICWWKCLPSTHSPVDSSVTFLHIHALMAHLHIHLLPHTHTHLNIHIKPEKSGK